MSTCVRAPQHPRLRQTGPARRHPANHTLPNSSLLTNYPRNKPVSSRSRGAMNVPPESCGRASTATKTLPLTISFIIHYYRMLVRPSVHASIHMSSCSILKNFYNNVCPKPLNRLMSEEPVLSRCRSWPIPSDREIAGSRQILEMNGKRSYIDGHEVSCSLSSA